MGMENPATGDQADGEIRWRAGSGEGKRGSIGIL